MIIYEEDQTKNAQKSNFSNFKLKFFIMFLFSINVFTDKHINK